MGYHISISNGCNEGEAIPRKKYVCNHGGHSYTKILRSSSPTWQLKTSSIKTKNTSAAWHGVQYDSAVFMFIFVQFGMGMGEEGQRREREREKRPFAGFPCHQWRQKPGGNGACWYGWCLKPCNTQGQNFMGYTNTLPIKWSRMSTFKHNHEVNPPYHVSEAHQTTAVMNALSPEQFEPTVGHN